MMRTLIVAAVLATASQAAADPAPCFCPAELAKRPLPQGQTGVPRNARFLIRPTVPGKFFLHLTGSTSEVPARFVPVPGQDGVGWLIPDGLLAPNREYSLNGEPFTTGDGVDTTPPTFSGVTTRAHRLWACGTQATRLLQPDGYSDDASELEGGVVMKVTLRRAGDPAEHTVYLPADGAVIGALEEKDPCGAVWWADHDAELVATVTLIDLAGNESAPSQVTFRLDLTEVDGHDHAGCAAGGGAPAAPIAAIIGALLAWRARRRGTPRG